MATKSERDLREHVYHAVCDTYGRFVVDAAMEAGQSVDDIWANGPAKPVRPKPVEPCGVRNGARREGGDGNMYDCCCNFPKGHSGPHRFLGLAPRIKGAS